MPRRSAPTNEDDLVNLNARVPRTLLRKVRAHCKRADVTMRAFITSALQQQLPRRRR